MRGRWCTLHNAYKPAVSAYDDPQVAHVQALHRSPCKYELSAHTQGSCRRSTDKDTHFDDDDFNLCHYDVGSDRCAPKVENMFKRLLRRR